MRKIKATALIAFCLLLFTGCNFENRVSKDISKGWKLCEGDSEKRAEKSFDDSTWEETDLKTIKLPKSGYCWLRKNVSIPSSFDKNSLWLGVDRVNSAVEIYGDGFYIGTINSMPPNYSIRTERQHDILIPSALIDDGEIMLAFRVYSPAGDTSFVSTTLDNEREAYFENHVHNVFSERIFVVIAFICLFLMLSTFFQYLGNRSDKTYLYFSLALLFVSVYFYDLGAEHIFLDYGIHRAICRASLPVSLSFTMLFMNSCFNGKHKKALLSTVLIVDSIIFISYLASINKNSVLELLFKLYLLFVIVTIVYGFTISAKAYRRKQKEAGVIFIGYAIATALASYDIIFMFINKIPFMWLQGLSFFVLDMAIFLTLTLRSTKSQIEVHKLVEKTMKQRDRLKEVFSSARQMINETMQIADSLEGSVDSVSAATKKSSENVAQIKNALKEQAMIQAQTEDAVHSLTDFLSRIADEFDVSTASIEKTANGTRQVMEGIDAVGDGISTAAGFSTSLSSMTSNGTRDMKELSEVMSKIQNSSQEILNVATTLDDFAQQTDLLSMNASIEAAHSGESGKGFAVIAHEIKNLAAQSSAWASKIGEIITSVIEEINGGVKLTEKVNATLSMIMDGASQSAEKVSIAASGIKEQQMAGQEVATESVRLSESALRMKKEVSEQSSFSSQVMGNMENLSKASQAVTQASSNITEGTVTLSEEVESLKSLALRMQEAAKKLQALMDNEH
ncbi:MAG: methyl-accepting chemotaxis protein [Treponema sp.]|nr:methyl-accepting chemotaxis protein [Treponema sp.]